MIFHSLYTRLVWLKKVAIYILSILLLLGIHWYFDFHLLFSAAFLLYLALSIFWCLFEFFRLTPFKELQWDDHQGYLLVSNSELAKIPLQDIVCVKSYYSLLDKPKGCTTICVYIGSGVIYRFAGIQDEGRFLEAFQNYQKKREVLK